MVIPDFKDDELRFKYNEVYPRESQVWYATKHIFNIWPELEQFHYSICVISASLAYPAFNNRDPKNVALEIRHEYNQGKRNFIFQCLDEGLALACINVIHEALTFIRDIKDDISVIYATGAFDGEEVYNELCKKENITPQLHIIAGANFERNSRAFLDFDIEYIQGPRQKKFLCFNKVDRQHRITLFEKLLELDLVKDAYYSFYLEDDTKSSLLAMKNCPYKKIINIIDELPLTLNRTIERDNPVDVRSDDLKYFSNSYFSVIPETLYFGMKKVPGELYINIADVLGIFPSEKIYKSLALKHPFILVTTAGFLKYLRMRGYKTFSPYIDESYDEIVDDTLRMNAIVKEIDRLCSLSKEQLIQFTSNVRPIVEYNRKHYFGIDEYRITKDVLSLLK